MIVRSGWIGVDQTAWMISRPLFTDIAPPCTSTCTVSFWYHLKGFTLGNVRLEAVDCNGDTTLLWAHDRQPLDLWRQAVVNVPAMEGAVRLRLGFYQVPFSQGVSDFAIDDIEFSNCVTGA